MPAVRPPAAASERPLTSWVNTFQGTDSYLRFSKGNTLPLTTRPHGMTAWIPQTDEGTWAFDYRSPTLQGFRATHQPSPWMSEYGNFVVLVGSGAQPPRTVIDGESFFPKDETVAQPHYFRTRLIRHDVLAEIAPTDRGAIFQFTFGAREHGWITLRPAAGRIFAVDRAARSITGISTAVGPGVLGFNGCYFAAVFDTPIREFEVFDAPASHPAPDGTTQGAWFGLELPLDRRVTLRIATSFISAEQALLNLRRELGTRSLTEIRDAAQADWDARLAVIAIAGATEAQRRTFYSCLYRSLLYPRLWHELDADHRTVHRSPFDGAVHAGPLYTDCGFWDVHRTLMPLLTLIAPRQHGEMIEGWLNAFREGGWLPSWACPGYVPCMVGSHAGVSITDAFRKGIRNFDTATAYAAVRHDATQEPRSFAFGRAGLTAYDRLGWVPADEFDHSTARTCDYALADFAAAQFARTLGHADDATRFGARARNYRHVFDSRTGFLRGRNADGSWREPFSEFAWSADYIEGSAWQHTWAAPHDAAGLAALFGGDDALVAKLDRMLSLPPRYEIGRYDGTIHEMTEMAAVPFGQYAHSNEPVHHALYLYTAAGRPDRTQHWVRRVLNELYSPDAFCGDEDNGAMSSWYILNALGLFPLTPGHPAWVLGAPLFPQATVQLESGRALVVQTKNFAPEACYVADVHWNGQRVESLELPHATLAAGGELTFTMKSDPELARTRGGLPRPYSFSTAT